MSRHDTMACTAVVCSACDREFGLWRVDALLTEAGPQVPEQRRRQLAEDIADRIGARR